MVTTPVVTATGTLKRTVSDKIRRLYPAVTPMLRLVKTAEVDDMGETSYSEGLISKTSSDTMKFEWFTYVPIDLFYTATGGSASTVTMADTTSFRTRDIITNLTNMDVAVVNTITSGTALAVTAVGSWTVTAGDIIAMSCRTMEEGTSDITPLTKEPDNNYNYLFPFRYAISIADTAINSPHYTEQPMVRYMKDNMQFVMANIENAFLFGQRASSGDTTSVSIGGTAFNMFTTRGLLNYATSPIDGSGMTFDKWSTFVFENLPKTQNPQNMLVMLCGRHIMGTLQSWANSKLIYMESGEPDEFGVRPKKFMCGAYTILPLMHNSFDQGPLASSPVIFDPDDLVYRYKTDMDITTKTNLQLPATWGETRAVQGVIGLQCWSGGANVRQIINWQ
jgi:hypothetical protein